MFLRGSVSKKIAQTIGDREAAIKIAIGDHFLMAIGIAIAIAISILAIGLMLWHHYKWIDLSIYEFLDRTSISNALTFKSSNVASGIYATKNYCFTERKKISFKIKTIGKALYSFIQIAPSLTKRKNDRFSNSIQTERSPWVFFHLNSDTSLLMCKI